MKGRITVSLDQEVIDKVGQIQGEHGASVSVIINRVLRKEFKMKG